MMAYMRRTPDLRYVLIVVLASALGIGLFNLWLTRTLIDREREGSERRQCEVFQAEVDYYQETPPDTERGRAREAYYRAKLRDYCQEAS